MGKDHSLRIATACRRITAYLQSLQHTWEKKFPKKKTPSKRKRGEEDAEVYIESEVLKADAQAWDSSPVVSSDHSAESEPEEAASEFEEVDQLEAPGSGSDEPDDSVQAKWETLFYMKPQHSAKAIKTRYAAGGSSWSSFLAKYPRFKKTKFYGKIVSSGRKKSEAALDKEQRSVTRQTIQEVEEPEAFLGAAVGGPSVLKKKKKTAKEIEDETVRSTNTIIERKARIRIEGQVHTDIFKIDIMRAQQPPLTRLKRLPNLNFVAALKAKIKNAPYAIVTPLCFQVIGLNDPKEFDLEKIKEYKYYALGGNHSRIAFRDLYTGRSTEEKSDALLSSQLRYRDCVLFADNLTDEECRILGEAHNVDNEFRAKMLFMDRLREATNSYYAADGITPAFPSQNAWKIAYLQTISEPASRIKHYNPMFVTARWDKRLLAKLDIVDNMISNGKLKNQNAKRNAGDKFQSLGSTYVTALNGLPDDMIYTHLMKVINGDWTLKEMHKSALLEKTKNRIMAAWVTLTGAQTDAEVVKRFGRPTIEQSFNNFAAMFSKDKAKPDKEFTNFVNAKLSAVIAREHIIKAATRQIRATSSAAGTHAEDDEEDFDDEEGQTAIREHAEYKGTKIDERLIDLNGVQTVHAFDLQMIRVFLLLAEFRGGAEEPTEDELGFPVDSTTKITIFKADVTAPAMTYMTGDFKLVLLDPPYGVLKDEPWDVKWEREHFKNCLENVLNYNTSPAFTFISFCSAEQISVLLEVVRSFESDTLQVGVTHGAWYKLEHHTARKFHFTLIASFLFVLYIIFCVEL